MASVYASVVAIISLVCVLPASVLSQNSTMISTPDPTITDCTPRLLPLTSCAPFVQGMARTPVQSCCDSLNQLYQEQPACICLLLNDTNLTSSPINRSLALELPALCNLQINIAPCSDRVPLMPSRPPASQVAMGARSSNSSVGHPNSSIAASPMVEGAPGSSITGFGLRQSASVQLTECPWVLLVTLAAAIYLSKAFF